MTFPSLAAPATRLVSAPDCRGCGRQPSRGLLVDAARPRRQPGAKAYGVREQVWTGGRIAAVMPLEVGGSYHPGDESRLSRNSRGWLQGVVRSGVTEELVSMQIQRESLEKPADVEDAIAPSLEHLHAVVESLHKPTGLPTLEVVRDLIHPPIDRPQNALELGHPTPTHPLAPSPHRAFGPRLRVIAF